MSNKYSLEGAIYLALFAKLDECYLPDTIARSATSHRLSVADAAGDTPTAAEFNALLTALRNAGYLATSTAPEE